MKAKDIRDLSLEELQGKLTEEVANYEKLRINHNVAQLESPIDLRKMRKDIARMQTVLTEKKSQA